MHLKLGGHDAPWTLFTLSIRGNCWKWKAQFICFCKILGASIDFFPHEEYHMLMRMHKGLTCSLITDAFTKRSNAFVASKSKSKIFKKTSKLKTPFNMISVICRPLKRVTHAGFAPQIHCSKCFAWWRAELYNLMTLIPSS